MPELIEMIARMHDEIGRLRRELHDAGRGHGARGTPEERQRRAQSRLERRRFQDNMRRLDREEAQMGRQEAHANVKAEHEERMLELERRKMEAKEEKMRREIEMNDVMTASNLALEGGQNARRLTDKV